MSFLTQNSLLWLAGCRSRLLPRYGGQLFRNCFTLETFRIQITEAEGIPEHKMLPSCSPYFLSRGVFKSSLTRLRYRLGITQTPALPQASLPYPVAHPPRVESSEREDPTRKATSESPCNYRFCRSICWKILREILGGTRERKTRDVEPIWIIYQSVEDCVFYVQHGQEISPTISRVEWREWPLSRWVCTARCWCCEAWRTGPRKFSVSLLGT